MNQEQRDRKRRLDRERLSGKLKRLAELERFVIFGEKKIAELTERAEIGDAIRREAMNATRLRADVESYGSAMDFWSGMADVRRKKIGRLERLLVGVSVLAGASIGVAGWAL